MDQTEIETQTRLIAGEGKLLYESEMASWCGTDIFRGNAKEKGEPGGYFSYSDNDRSTCILFSKGDKPQVIGTITFDSTYTFQGAEIDLSEREFTKYEADLFAIRSIALEAVNSDPFFKKYEKTNLNLVPLISNGEKKVYVLTAPQETGVLIFGNDYLLTFNDENRFVNKKQIHQNIIVQDFREASGEIPEGARMVAANHIHLPATGDFITATDICTLMLYQEFFKLKSITLDQKIIYQFGIARRMNLISEKKQ